MQNYPVKETDSTGANEIWGKYAEDKYLCEKITIEKNGSINITGGVKVIDDNNSEEILDSKEHYSLCRCGHSKHKPFCDGTHKHIKFNDEE
jgi:CDGSH-type Zn-finger protein